MEQPETIIEVDIPKISLDLGDQVHFVKFPNFLSVEPRFDYCYYRNSETSKYIVAQELFFRSGICKFFCKF